MSELQAGGVRGALRTTTDLQAQPVGALSSEIIPWVDKDCPLPAPQCRVGSGPALVVAIVETLGYSWMADVNRFDYGNRTRADRGDRSTS